MSGLGSEGIGGARWGLWVSMAMFVVVVGGKKGVQKGTDDPKTGNKQNARPKVCGRSRTTRTTKTKTNARPVASGRIRTKK